ncbi:MAG: hypothetical protein IJK67_02740 [Bacilli bacterium]|nr:hypothetical protein [Bacilli bacterium]
MKKVFYVILGILLILPLTVNADMSAPMIERYKAVVTNPNGARLYEYGYDAEDDTATDELVATNVFIPYNKQIEVEGENEDGETAWTDDYDGFFYLRDITLVKKDYKIDTRKYGEKFTSTVLKDTVIKKGPAEIYDSTGVTIKAGETITLRLVDSEWNPWAYVEYNGIKGFINTMGGTVTYDEVEIELITNVMIKLNDKVTIPVNTVLKKDVYNLDPWNSKYYVKYNGAAGYINEEEIVSKSDETMEITALEDLNIYEQANELINKKNLKVIGKLKKGTTFKTYYYDDYQECTAYYEKDNVKGWIYTEYDYENELDNGEYYCGVQFGDEDEEEYEDPIETPDNPEVIVPIDINPNPTPTEIKRNPSMETLYWCLAAVAVVSITSIVTIVLINKKKNKEEVKENVKPEEKPLENNEEKK